MPGGAAPTFEKITDLSLNEDGLLALQWTQKIPDSKAQFEINTNAGSFDDAGRHGSLYVKAILNSNGATACSLDALSLSGNMIY